MTTTTTYTTATGETRTTCGAHRTVGYAVDMLVGWRCRGCGLPQSVHESTDETIARRAAEQQTLTTS